MRDFQLVGDLPNIEVLDNTFAIFVDGDEKRRRRNSNIICNVTFSINENHNPFYNYC